MAWIESHQSLSRHRKTMRVVALLGVDRHKLIGHLHELWWWALDNVPADGYLGDLTDQEIAAAAEWDGDPEEFVRALTLAGFVDVTPEGRYLHDWWDYAGKLLDRREKDKARKFDIRRAYENGTIDAVRARDGNRCRYCGREVDWADRRTSKGGTYDHVNPFLPATVENLVVACRGCNSRKAGRTPAEAGMTLLPPPGQQGIGSASDAGLNAPSNADLITQPNPTVPNPTEPNPTEPDVVLSKESSNCVDAVLLSSSHRADSAEPSPAAPATPDEPPPPQRTRRLRIWGEDTEEYRLARLLRDEILRNLPTARVPKATPAAMAPWCRQIDLLLRVDKRAPPEIERVIRWCQRDPFWQSNILSPKKLREKWDTLVLQMRRRETEHGGAGGDRADSGANQAQNRTAAGGKGSQSPRTDYWSGILGRRAVNRVPAPAGAGAEGATEPPDTS